MSTDLWWRGVIRRTPKGDAIYIHALRSTAVRYGWDVAFDPQRPDVALPGLPNGRCYVGARNPTGRIGGRHLLISRSPVKKSKSKGQVNRFRIARQATNRDIARVAWETRGDWGWMTDKTGLRLDRAAWALLRI
jgi:hypothetical protein